MTGLFMRSSLVFPIFCTLIFNGNHFPQNCADQKFGSNCDTGISFIDYRVYSTNIGDSSETNIGLVQYIRVFFGQSTYALFLETLTKIGLFLRLFFKSVLGCAATLESISCFLVFERLLKKKRSKTAIFNVYHN